MGKQLTPVGRQDHLTAPKAMPDTGGNPGGKKTRTRATGGTQ